MKLNSLAIALGSLLASFVSLEAAHAEASEPRRTAARDGASDAPKAEATDEAGKAGDPKTQERPRSETVKADPAKLETARAAETEASATPKAPELSMGSFSLAPYVVIAAGLKYDNVILRKGEQREDRISTFATSRFGLNGKYGEHLALQSELMAGAGTGLHGSSTYEGQAALQVRQQLVRVSFDRFVIEGGRVLDEASADFVSGHVQDTLLQDTATRDPLLYSGYNLGNGLRSTVSLGPYVRAGFAFNAGNPVSNTATLMVGGTFPPFERLFTQAYQSVNAGANHFPDDTFHSMIFTPSLMVDTPYFDARLAFQAFTVDTNTTSKQNDAIRGYNARGTLRGKLLDGKVVPFFNASTTRNDTVLPNDVSTRAPDRYKAIVLGGGLDVNVAKRHECKHDCRDGIGAQFEQVQFQIGDGVVTSIRYANLGATVWALPYLAVGARFAWWQQHQNGIDDTGERNFTLALRGVLQ
jgi:hypothetical protein